MKCPKCGYVLPEDSKFCQYCGEKLPFHTKDSDDVDAPEKETVADIESKQSNLEPPQIFYEENISSSQEKSSANYQTTALLTLQEELIANDLTQTKSESPVDGKKKKFCKYCGGPIDLNTIKCILCGKQFSRFPKRSVVIISLLIIFLALAGLNVYQYVSNASTISGLKQQIEAKSSTISDLVQQIETKDETISTQKTTISNQKNEIFNLDNKAGHYDDICNALKSGNIGAASSNFKVSDGIIVLAKGKTKHVTLTTSFCGPGTISVDYSGSSAYVSFDEDTWHNTTTLTIDPWAEGVTVATFSKTANSQTFKMVIIVTNS